MRLREEAGGPVTVPDMRVELLTSGGVSVDAAISPDGRYVARIERLGSTDRSRILLRQLSTGSEVEILSLREALLDWLAFSPDGSYVYYTDYTENGRLLRVPTLGGTPRRIADRLSDMPPSCSPDGAQVVVVRSREGGDGQEVVIIAVDGAEEQVIASKESGWYSSPAWSPDGETIVFNSNAPNRLPQTIAIGLGDGSERVIAEIPGLSRMVWMPDGTALVGNIGTHPRHTRHEHLPARDRIRRRAIAGRDTSELVVLDLDRISIGSAGPSSGAGGTGDFLLLMAGAGLVGR
jgi:sugar lactone lactonase YvrE